MQLLKNLFKPKQNTITVTESELAAAFTEWNRRFYETPEEFDTNIIDQGQEHAAYFMALLNELKNQ